MGLAHHRGAGGRYSFHPRAQHKIPTAYDVPARSSVAPGPSPTGGQSPGSKAVGAATFMLGISVWEAIRDAVAAARGQGPVQMDAPATAERVLGAKDG